MSTWKDLTEGDTVTVRTKRTASATESVVVARILDRTRADGPRFESTDGRLFTFYLHDLTDRTPRLPTGATAAQSE